MIEIWTGCLVIIVGMVISLNGLRDEFNKKTEINPKYILSILETNFGENSPYTQNGVPLKSINFVVAKLKENKE